MSKSIQIGDLRVEGRELTVDGAMALLKQTPESWDEANLLFEGFTLEELTVTTNLTREELGGLTPHQVEQVAEVARGANPHFFKVRVRMEGISTGMTPGADSGASVAP